MFLGGSYFIFVLCVASVVSLVSCWKKLVGYSVNGLVCMLSQYSFVSFVMLLGSLVSLLVFKPNELRLVRLPIYYGSSSKPISYMNSCYRLCILNNHFGS